MLSFCFQFVFGCILILNSRVHIKRCVRWEWEVLRGCLKIDF